jgi:hypothetical protein
MPAPDMFWLTLQWPNRWSHDTFERTNRTEGIVIPIMIINHHMEFVLNCFCILRIIFSFYSLGSI